MASVDLKTRINKHLLNTGFYEKSTEEKLFEHEKCYEQLKKIKKGDYEIGKKYLEY